MGLVSDTERQEFESLCEQYPEILAAREAFEISLEEKLLKDARMPPQHLKQLIEERIVNPTPETGSISTRPERTPVRQLGFWKWMAAASLILLAGTGYWAFTNYQQNRELRSSNSALENRLRASDASLVQLKQQADMLQKPGMKMAALKGTAHAPQAFATVYWDTASSRDVYLLVNNMPQPPADKQYQLWALLNGNPINLGVFDMRIRQDKLLVKMQHVQQAQAFAITIEPMGGSQKPTMDSMYVMGTL